VRRFAIVRQGGGDDGIRRLRLARLDEIALASPPESATTPKAPDAAPSEEPADDEVDSGSRRAA
jgi:hypothetical protein